MRSLNRRIVFYLLALWAGLVTVGALGYVRLKAVHRVSDELIQGVYPSAAAALEVESAIHQAYKNTYVYCSYLEEGAKTKTREALDRAGQALQTYDELSIYTPRETIDKLQGLLDEAERHAMDCLRMTDAGMTPGEFRTHLDELANVQMRVVVALRESAGREQAKMLAGTEKIEAEVDTGLKIFVGGTALLLVVAFGIGYRLSSHIIPPINVLTNAATRFSERDLSIRVSENFTGEFGILARAFNTMATRIRCALEENAQLLREARESQEKYRDLYAQEQALRQQLLQSQKLESLGTLSGGIAHDFNNILTSMMGFAQLAMLNLDDDAPQYEHMDRVVKLGDQAAGLTKQLLTFSRQTPSERTRISLEPLAKESVKVLERTLPESIQIYSHIHRDIATVEADATQIQQVLMNLCVNARDAMPDGGTLTISLENVELDAAPPRRHGNRPDGAYVRLSIRDTGTGIPADVEARIFEPFFTTKEVGKGTGLGLAIVHGIVESHGGHIQLQTAPGEGTEFQIYMPAVEGDSVVEPAMEEQTQGTETLLLVEDDANVREIAQKMLEERGYTVIAANNGAEGLAHYKRHKDAIKLVVTDVVMPNLGGLDLCREIEQINPDAKVLLMSGYSNHEQPLPLDNIAGFLQKPFDLTRLGAEIRTILDGAPQLA